MNKNYQNKKTYRQLERIIKGGANHRRIQIMELLKKEPELSVMEISEKLNINFKTASEHTRRLAVSNLILKRNDLNFVRHKLTKNGKTILKFLRILE
ncbi:MAG: winged helix-turn-helix transcriptional regulator [Candidatus Pacebacteria bacterium]|nr:winged helix-turn-helix transcriptional regulator [Candidatus Paceibacterota bacterium]